MAYATGTLSSANSSLELYNVLAGLLTTANYTLVDTVVISTRTHKVWKCAAANNSMNLDWYLDAAYTTTGTGPVHLTPFEFYDPATHLGYRGAYSGSSSTIETTYYSRYGATGYALETNWFSVSGNGIATSSSSGYWLTVTGDRVIGLSSEAPSYLRYAGFYETTPSFAAHVGAANYPLVKSEFTSSPVSTSTSSLTRAPLSTTVANGWNYMSGVSPEVSVNRAGLVGSAAPSGRLPIAARLALGSELSLYDFDPLPGYLRDVYAVRVPSTAVRGDTVSIGGNTYTVATPVLASSAYIAAAFRLL